MGERLWVPLAAARRRALLVAVAAVVGMVPAEPAKALVATGKIRNYTVSVAGNAPFRVYLEPNQTAGCANNFLWVDVTTSNYSAFVAGLLTAYSQGLTVTIWFNKLADATCQIFEVNAPPLP